MLLLWRDERGLLVVARRNERRLGHAVRLKLRELRGVDDVPQPHFLVHELAIHALLEPEILLERLPPEARGELRERVLTADAERRHELRGVEAESNCPYERTSGWS